MGNALAAIVVGVLICAGFLYLLARVTGAVEAKMKRAVAEAATALRLLPRTCDRDEGAELLALPRGDIVSDPELYAGEVDGVPVRIAAVTIKSRTTVNGVRVPVLIARIVADYRAPLVPEALEAQTKSDALAGSVDAFLAGGQGCAEVTPTHVETMVFHRDPERIAESAKLAAYLAGALAPGGVVSTRPS